MRKHILLCLSVFLSISITASTIIKDSKWHIWKAFHGKEYTSPEEEYIRYGIWNGNMKMIKKHNLQKRGFTLEMNHLGDLTTNEVKMMLNGYRDLRKSGEKTDAVTFLEPNNIDLPKEVDWRKHGYVTKVKNQGACGSCWAFSTTGSLEGQHFKKTHKLVSLSEQNLVDCSRKFGNFGCEGGLMDDAFKYIKVNGGIDTEISYPYTAEDDKCSFNKSDIGAEDTGFVDVEHYSEEALKVAVGTVGPISVAIDAGHMSFQFYHHGVYNEPDCSSTLLDHGVLAVGYGTAANGEDYWLVKNSWGPSWGEEGYIRMSRNKNNQCGIASNASYPLV